MNRTLLFLLVLTGACGRTTANELELEKLGSPPSTRCADEGEACASDGWTDGPERCCISRMTCFKRAGALRGTCAYSNWCAAEDQPCLANGGDDEVPGHCCNPRHTCKQGLCKY